MSPFVRREWIEIFDCVGLPYRQIRSPFVRREWIEISLRLGRPVIGNSLPS